MYVEFVEKEGQQKHEDVVEQQLAVSSMAYIATFN